MRTEATLSHAPKTSLLGWQMDHVWMVRPQQWRVWGEVVEMDGTWRAVAGQISFEDGVHRWNLGEGVVREDIPDSAGNGRGFTVMINTTGARIPCILEPQGARQILTGAFESLNLCEFATQRADGSVEIDGVLADGGQALRSWRYVLSMAYGEETWSLPIELLREIRLQAKGGSPIEQCGLLVGLPAEKRLTRMIPMTNVDASEDHFTMDPKEQFRAVKSLRGTAEELVGNWHSHPFSPARLSDEDLTHAVDPSALYAIVSLMQPGDAPLRAYRVVDGHVAPVRLQLEDGSPLSSLQLA